MPLITDVSPRKSNTNLTDINHSAIGRMLSIACSPDGETLYAGSYSNLWKSNDGGKHWEQLAWPQPPPEQYDAPGAIGGWCVVDIAASLGWRVDKHPRFLADLTGDGKASIVGFGDCGVWTSLGNGDGTFQLPNVVLANFGHEAGSWRVDQHPRFLADLTGDGKASIVGFGDAGVWTAKGDGQGGFADAQFVLENFGNGQTVLAITRNDRVKNSRGIWRSTDGGASWTKVHQFPMLPGRREAVGQLEWAAGSDHLVYAAGGTSLAISKDGGASFQDVFPWGTAPAASVHHVAVWQNAPADFTPAVIYALGTSTMYVSFDGGASWMRDKGTLPDEVGGPVSSVANGSTPKVMVVSPRWPLEVYVAGDGNAAVRPGRLYRGDYSQFPLGTQTSAWESVVLPKTITGDPEASTYEGQDAGMVFLATTRKGRGDLLFYCAQRRPVFVGPLYPEAGADWHRLDADVHFDLHGMLLSPDFGAEIEGGEYKPGTGRMWLLSDGGIHWSTDGGREFHAAEDATTLSSVNVAGVAIPGKGPALSLNTGDNDGFYSADGGAHWSYQDYGGGDNDCSYADPLRPHSMLVLTPRWNTEADTIPGTVHHTVTVYEASSGNLPNAASGTSSRHIVPGPPLLQPDEKNRDLWNAKSLYMSRGSRPIVHTIPGEVPPDQGDYVFVLNPTMPPASPTAGERAAARQPVVVRTQRILDITSREEWRTTATGPAQGSKVYRQGPIPLPAAGLNILQTSGGHASTVFYLGEFPGGNGTLWSWTEGQASWNQLVPGAGVSFATRFFVDPYRPNVIYVLDRDHVKRSDDGGNTWQIDQNLETQLTWDGRLALGSNDNSSGVSDWFDLILTDVQFDPRAPIRFAVGEGGAFGTYDGVNWSRLLHTGALPSRPGNCYYDWHSNHDEPALYVATAGRGLVKITGLWGDIIL